MNGNESGNENDDKCSSCGQPIPFAEADCPNCGRTRKIHTAELYWIKNDGGTNGPFTFSQVQSMWKAGTVKVTDQIMRDGENARATIAAVKAKLAEIAVSLPAGVKIVPAYDRARLIDRVIDNLARLRRSGQMSEADLSQTLAPLFNRREFYGVSAGDWQALLYPLFRTQVLLEQNLENFKSNPLVRDSLTQANRRMAMLEDRVAVLYGPNFRLSDNIRDYGASVGLFKSHLPAVIDAPSAEVLAACDEDIKVVRSLIRKAGFPIQ